MFGKKKEKTVFIGNGKYQLKKEYMDIFKEVGFDPEVVIREVEEQNEFLIMPKETALLPELEKIDKKFDYPNQESTHTFKRRMYSAIFPMLAEVFRGKDSKYTFDTILLAFVTSETARPLFQPIEDIYREIYTKVYEEHCKTIYDPVKDEYLEDQNLRENFAKTGTSELGNLLYKTMEAHEREMCFNKCIWKEHAYNCHTMFWHMPHFEKYLFEQRIKSGFTDGVLEHDPVIWALENYGTSIDIFTEDFLEAISGEKEYKIGDFHTERKAEYGRLYQEFIGFLKEKYLDIFYNGRRDYVVSDLLQPDFSCPDFIYGVKAFIEKAADETISCINLIYERMMTPQPVEGDLSAYGWNNDATYPVNLMESCFPLETYIPAHFPMAGETGRQYKKIPGPDTTFLGAIREFYGWMCFSTLDAIYGEHGHATFPINDHFFFNEGR